MHDNGEVPAALAEALETLMNAEPTKKPPKKPPQDRHERREARRGSWAGSSDRGRARRREAPPRSCDSGQTGRCSRCVAAVIGTRGEEEVAYWMFEVRELSPEGAFFAGPLLLEEGEEVTVELLWTVAAPAPPEGQACSRRAAGPAAEDSARARARVVSVARGQIPGMAVALTGLGERDRAIIGRRAAAGAEPEPADRFPPRPSTETPRS